MQCLNCGFENVPGLSACVRCQSMLDLSSLDIHPPRSRRRGSGPAESAPQVVLAARNFRMRTADAARRAFNRRVLGPVLAGIIPGVLQLRAGRRRLGRFLLIAWIAAILLATLVLCGQWLGFVALILLPTIHGISIGSAIAQHCQMTRFWRRFALGCGLTIALMVLVYRPIQLEISRHVQVIQIAHMPQPSRWLADGDVILCSDTNPQSRSLRAGEVVAYQMVYGVGIDRILGGPGDTLEVVEGKVLINGQELPEELGPLGRVPWPQQDKTTAGPNEYLILPSLLGYMQGGHPEHDALQRYLAGFTRVPADRILDKPVWRTAPLSRWGAFR